jgi:hypothetical protein
LDIQQIFWTSIEYKYTNCSPGLTGGFVYGFVKAFDEQEAMLKFTSELTRQALEIKQVEFISLYDVNTRWETKTISTTFAALFQYPQRSNEVIFDTFYAYSAEG